ncbi:glycosyltransferase family 9 protein [Desulfobulbus elongatus]|uniref:glycosyltransferase family 9 protein n=1 Tax=Desulfobulbus elongatus TaxID=53332 RepID=UPI0004819B42|nr:glycosyltransferase family 9 protein [Desulfobulbus elongatus]
MDDRLDGKRILLIKQSSLGDVIHALPVAHALKRCAPSCRIGWVVEAAFASLVARDPAVDEVYPIHVPSTSDPDATRGAYFRACTATIGVLARLRAAFRQAPYDWVLDLHASFRSGLFALMNPGGVRVGFGDARELNTLFQHRLLTVASGPMHAVDKNLLFCSFFGCSAREEDLYLVTDRNDEDQAEAFLRASGIGPEQRFVYVNPAARWQSKFWIASRWSALCDLLESAGVRTVFGGSPGDRAHIETIVTDMRHEPAVAAGRLSLMASAALMKKAAAYVGVDTGPMHMAAMAGTPVVALFGPTHPERVGPYGMHNAVIQAEGLDCLCCRKRVCAQQRCMEGITVERVYDRVMTLIGEVTPR